jgi:hypothetical protein
LCFSSVVRMKPSYWMSSRAHRSRKTAAIRSLCSCGLSPFSRAMRSMFCPCSSVPVRKNTRAPARRRARVSASTATVL